MKWAKFIKTRHKYNNNPIINKKIQNSRKYKDTSKNLTLYKK